MVERNHVLKFIFVSQSIWRDTFVIKIILYKIMYIYARHTQRKLVRMYVNNII